MRYPAGGYQRRRGEASFANCEVISANVTASDVRTSSTVGPRVESASDRAGAIAARVLNADPAATQRAGDCGMVPIVELGRNGPDRARPSPAPCC